MNKKTKVKTLNIRLLISYHQEDILCLQSFEEIVDKVIEYEEDII